MTDNDSRPFLPGDLFLDMYLGPTMVIAATKIKIPSSRAQNYRVLVMAEKYIGDGLNWNVQHRYLFISRLESKLLSKEIE